MQITHSSFIPSKSLRNLLILPGSLYYILFTSLGGQDLTHPSCSQHLVHRKHTELSLQETWGVQATQIQLLLFGLSVRGK